MSETRYFLHIRDNHRFIVDPEGIVVSCLDEARGHARNAAIELRAEGLLDGDLTEDRRFELTDKRGALRAILPFAQLLNDAPDPS